jgi:hypothetical protein
LAIALLVGSYFLVAVAVIWFYAQAGGLAQLIYANVIWPITNYGRVNGISYAHGIIFYREDWAAALKSIVSPVVAIGVANFFIVPLVIVAGLPLLLGLFGLRYKNLAFTRVTLPYWVAGFAFWLSEMHRKDIVHLIYGSPLLMILLVHLYRQLPHRIVRRTLEVIAICTVSLLIVNAGVVLSAQNRLTTKRGTLYSFHPSPVLDFLNSHTESGEAIFAYPYCPIYYFLASATNPTRLSILLYHMNTDSQFREAIRTLKRVKVHYVIWDTTFYARAKQALPGLRAPQTEQQIVEAFLMQYYKPLANYDGVQILQRKDEGIYTSSKDQSVRRRTDDES